MATIVNRTMNTTCASRTNSMNRRTRLRNFALPACCPFLLASQCTVVDVPPAGLSGDIGGASDYVGAIVCRGCHSEIHSSWLTARHAGALDTLVAAGQQHNPDCLACHTTGYRKGGFVSAIATPGFAGVQCEECHGTGAAHVGSRSPADIIRLPTADTCGKCHTGPAQPNHEEWLSSRHARALSTIRNSPERADSCLNCHSFDYASAVQLNQTRAGRGLPPLPLPSLTDASAVNDPREGVTCLSCHAPHGSTQIAELRHLPTPTCVTCHNDPQPRPGIRPHAPQWNILSAGGGRRPDPVNVGETLPLTGIPAVHSNLNPVGGCAYCHGPNFKPASPTADNPSLSGHRFEVRFDLCLPCHTPDVAESLTNSLRSELVGRMQAVRDRIAAIPAHDLIGPNRKLVDAALLNLDLIDQDGSTGVHNAAYVRSLVEEADNLLDLVRFSP